MLLLTTSHTFTYSCTHTHTNTLAWRNACD